MKVNLNKKRRIHKMYTFMQLATMLLNKLIPPKQKGKHDFFEKEK